MSSQEDVGGPQRCSGAPLIASRSSKPKIIATKPRSRNVLNRHAGSSTLLPEHGGGDAAQLRAPIKCAEGASFSYYSYPAARPRDRNREQASDSIAGQARTQKKPPFRAASMRTHYQLVTAAEQQSSNAEHTQRYRRGLGNRLQ